MSIEKKDEQVEIDSEKVLVEFMQAKGIDRETALRFCVPAKFRPDKAESLYRCYATKLAENGWEGLRLRDVFRTLRKRIIYLPGSRDRNGSMLLVLEPLKFGQALPKKELLKAAFYLGELCTRDPETQREGLSVIIYLEGAPLCGVDTAFCKEILALLQEALPLRLKAIFLFNPPCWLRFSFAFCGCLLKGLPKNRLHTATQPLLLESFALDQLPVLFGGEFLYNPILFIAERAREEDIQLIELMRGRSPIETRHVSFKTGDSSLGTPNTSGTEAPLGESQELLLPQGTEQQVLLAAGITEEGESPLSLDSAITSAFIEQIKEKRRQTALKLLMLKEMGMARTVALQSN